jgi:hypothetical protein
MMIRIGKKNEGISITFELRGIDKYMANSIWLRLHPIDIKRATEETGHNLFVWKDGLACEIKRTEKNNYVVWCGREIK